MIDSLISGANTSIYLRRLDAEENSLSKDSLDSLIQETVAKILAAENKNNLNGFNISRLVTRVKNYLNLAKDRTDVENIARILLRGPQGKTYLDLCQNKEDFKYVVELLQNNAEPMLIQLNQRYNANISFASLLNLRRQHPDQSIAQLLVYLVADSNPELAPYAQKILPGKQITFNDPHIQYVRSLQSQIKLTKLEPAQIYEKTNTEDREYLQKIELKKDNNKKDLELHNYKRLANLDIEKNNSPEEKIKFLKARIQEAMKVQIPA